MPQLFGSAIGAFIVNGALWYYLLGKMPLALFLMMKGKLWKKSSEYVQNIDDIFEEEKKK